MTAVNPATGEITDILSACVRLTALMDALEAAQPELERLLGEQQRVSLRCDLVTASTVATSTARSEDRRRAEAVQQLARETLPDSPEDLLTRRSVLDMRIRAMREAMHNLRAQIHAAQTLSANLRVEANIGGGVRP